MNCIVGDCIEVMRGMAEASVAAIVTDPPRARIAHALLGQRVSPLEGGAERRRQRALERLRAKQ